MKCKPSSDAGKWMPRSQSSEETAQRYIMGGVEVIISNGPQHAVYLESPRNAIFDAESSEFQDTKKAYHNHSRIYSIYANGVVKNENDLLNFKGRQFGFEDEQMWCLIMSEISLLIRKGKKSIRILDVGCGDGIWLLRVAHACQSTFGIDVRGVGIDYAPNMIQEARQKLDWCRRNFPHFRFDVDFKEGDICERLPFADREFDITLCLNTVLNHVAAEQLAGAANNLLRVTNEVNISSVKATGSPKTAYICSMSAVEEFDQRGDWLKLTLKDGTKETLRSHLFTPEEFKSLFSAVGTVKELMGHDILASLFVENRFSDETWPAPYVQSLESALCHQNEFIDKANHMVIMTIPSSAIR